MNSNIILAVNNNVVENKLVEKLVRKKSKKSKVRLREPRRIAQRKVEAVQVVDTDACVSVWQSVVVQAFYDLISAADNYEQRLDRARAITWFGQGVGGFGKQTDLETVCELAGLDIYAVMKLSRRAIRGDMPNGEKLISGFNFRTLRKDSSSRMNKRG